MAPLLSVKGLTLRRDDGEGSAILNDFNLEVEEGEVLIIKGTSGSGKTSLLKCIAELNVYQKGEIFFRGKKPSAYGIPTYRTLVSYIPQRPSLLPGTPLSLLTQVRAFASRSRPSSSSTSSTTSSSTSSSSSSNKKRTEIDPMDLAEEWGIEKTLWGREWGTLSGGEGQRIALALGVGIGGAEIVLLDEPTSALDEKTMQRVERSLVGMLPPLRTRHSESDGIPRKGTGPKALIWITHESSQAERVGTRTLDISRE